ncbi:MAG: Ig-like domain-containing protein [Prevotella sp.]|nr:Ig-like domain-containing protein [Prevotella sp.]
MGQPDGGWYDETPPHVVGSMPADKSTGVDSRNVTIYFDEFIKLDNPTEKVVISPPQTEYPEIKGAGKRITVQLNDSLRPNTTYTIDFSDAISDNNEGNPLGNYTYSFSTGSVIDTMEVSGYVLEAENLEPIKGILVGLYDNLSDTAFTTTPMLRVARTDPSGRFQVKGVAPGQYRIYALQEADGDYRFSQKSEKIAFNHDIIVPSSKPDVRQDTLWRDSLHIETITQTGYTHFLPDDIVLRAFTETPTDRFLVKTERQDADHFTFYFTAGHEQAPKIQGLNFDEHNAFLLESSELRDTLHYWLRDTLLVNQDTLNMVVTYMATDTTGVLSSKTDTLSVLAKTPLAKRQKEQQKEYEKWQKKQDKAQKKGDPVETEMPVKPLDLKLQVTSDMSPFGYIGIESATPIARIDSAGIRLYVRNDTVWERKPYVLAERTLVADKDIPPAQRVYVLRPDTASNLWTLGKEYKLEVDSAAFTDIYGNACAATKKGATVKTAEDFSTIIFHMTRDQHVPYVGELLDKSERVVRQVSSGTGDFTFEYVKPGEYYLRFFADANDNGRWDTGEYASDLQAETLYYYPEKIECKARWPYERSWNPAAVPAFRQKPSALIKQKSDKQKKTIKNRNAERAQKLGIIYIPKNM